MCRVLRQRRSAINAEEMALSRRRPVVGAIRVHETFNAPYARHRSPLIYDE